MDAKTIVTSIGGIVIAAALVAGCGKKETATPAPRGGDTAAAVTSAAKTPGGQTTCPIMGGAIRKDIYADYDGKRVYFCCNGCVSTFKSDPAKYIKKLEDAGVTIEKAPAGSTKESEAKGGDGM